MNYIKLLQDSWHILRTNRLIWIFGFFPLLLTIPLPLTDSLRQNPALLIIYLPAAGIVSLVTIIAYGALYFVIHQASLNQTVLLSKAWSHGRPKMLRLFGLFLISIPILLIGGFFIQVATAIASAPVFLWLIALVEILFYAGFLTFGSCAITIDNIKTLAATWTSFLITINNFGRIFIISGSIFLLRLLIAVLAVMIIPSGWFGVELPTPLALDYPTYQKILTIPIVAWVNWLFNLFLFPFEATMLTLIYLKSTKDIAYPALVEKQTTA